MQYVIAADTGSADDSAQLLAEALGDDRVLHLARRTGFGTAVEEAVTHRRRPDPRRPALPEAAQRLGPRHPHLARRGLRDAGTARTASPSSGCGCCTTTARPTPTPSPSCCASSTPTRSPPIIGPKLRSWYDRRQLLEVGVTIARSGRRWTGLDRREQDQGQHDQVRTVLSVSTAGMLVRRDVFEQLGGFDRRLPLMRDDVDLCWRAHAAGHRVLVAPDAVLRHAEAASRERRTVDCAGRTAVNPHRVDKAGAVYTLLANTRGTVLPTCCCGSCSAPCCAPSPTWSARSPDRRSTRSAACSARCCAPARMIAARTRRGRPAVDSRRTAPAVPATRRHRPGHRRAGRGHLARRRRRRDRRRRPARRGRVRTGRRRRRLPGDRAVRPAQALARKPGAGALPRPAGRLAGRLPRTCSAAARSPAAPCCPPPPDVGDLWARYAGQLAPRRRRRHRSRAAVPRDPRVLAWPALRPPTGLALTLLLVCSVPLAGVTAYFASRPLVESRLLRAWASVATPSCPPPPARSPAAGSAPPSWPSCCR